MKDTHPYTVYPLNSPSPPGYFQKQGFSKHITMGKERWVGYIKDYDGGRL